MIHETAIDNLFSLIGSVYQRALVDAQNGQQDAVAWLDVVRPDWRALERRKKMSKHKPFKATERAVAKMLGAERTGHTGKADVSGAWVSAECKHRKTIPQWLKEAHAQARRYSKESQLPIVVLHEHGDRHGNDLVVMSMADFQQWFGEVGHRGIVTDEEEGQNVPL